MVGAGAIPNVDFCPPEPGEPGVGWDGWMDGIGGSMITDLEDFETSDGWAEHCCWIVYFFGEIVFCSGWKIRRCNK